MLVIRQRFLLLGLLVPCFSPMAQAENWPQFRGPGGQGVATSKNLPISWDAETNVVWSRKIPGNGWSSPVVADGKIFVTTAVVVGEENVASEGEFSKKVTNPYSLRTVCIDYETGNILWNVETSQVPSETSIHPKNSHASSTPLVTSDRIYVHFGAYGTAALDLDGNIIWKQQIDYEPIHGSGSSLIVYDDLIIVNCDGKESPFVIALDAATGNERWRTARPEYTGQRFSFSTPLVIDVEGESQLISAGSHAACGYDPKTGKELWVVRYPEKWSVVPRPVFADGIVLICTGYEGPAELLAIRPDGEGDVTETHIAWRADKFVPHNPSPIIDNGLVFLVSDDGIATCRDLKTGELHWKQRLGGKFSASPILGEGRIYFLSENGVCTVVNAAKDLKQLAKNELGETTFASIVPMDGTLLIRTESQLFRIGK